MSRELEKLVKILNETGQSLSFSRLDGTVGVIPAGSLFQSILEKIQGRDPQESVLHRGTNTPPSSPAQGDRYIIGTSPTGLWAGHANQIAEWDDGWKFTVPTKGMFTFVEDENAQYEWSGSAWILILSIAGVHSHVWNQPLTGVVNGVNDTFTLASAPNPAVSLLLFKNGILMRVGVGNDYVLSGNTITFQSGQIPQVGDIMLASWTI